MNAEDFAKSAYENKDKDYGICPPPTDAKAGMEILIDHFLGEDWHVGFPLSSEQVNTEAIYQILKQYPENGKIRKWICNFKRRMTHEKMSCQMP